MVEGDTEDPNLIYWICQTKAPWPSYQYMYPQPSQLCVRHHLNTIVISVYQIPSCFECVFLCPYDCVCVCVCVCVFLCPCVCVCHITEWRIFVSVCPYRMSLSMCVSVACLCAGVISALARSPLTAILLRRRGYGAWETSGGVRGHDSFMCCAQMVSQRPLESPSRCQTSPPLPCPLVLIKQT